MKFYSEVTKRLYDTEEAVSKAEAEVKAKQEAARKAKEEKEMKAQALKAQRETRAKEVEAAFQAVADAQTKANKLLTAFNKDYGSFHMTVKDADVANLFPNHSLFDWLLNAFD